MIEIVLATNNKDKVREIKALLKGLPVKVLTAQNFPHFPKVKEDGKNLEENALKKAEAISRYTGKIALADDTGLEVNILKGLPGVRSARFAGPCCSYTDNNQKLLRALKKLSWSKRKACFRCVLALAFPGKKTVIRAGKIAGYISEELKGKQGFGYDPIFYVPAYKKTFAELGLKTKNKISHRAQALQKIRKVIKKIVTG
ncbi:MAG: XTP/dITP diphosphatase [Elusimicrobiota bacterium]